MKLISHNNHKILSITLKTITKILRATAIIALLLFLICKFFISSTKLENLLAMVSLSSFFILLGAFVSRMLLKYIKS